MNDYINKIQELENKVNDNKTELTKITERLKINTDEKKKVLAELKELGISEGDLENKIIELDTELNDKITKIERELE